MNPDSSWLLSSTYHEAPHHAFLLLPVTSASQVQA